MEEISYAVVDTRSLRLRHAGWSIAIAMKKTLYPLLGLTLALFCGCKTTAPVKTNPLPSGHAELRLEVPPNTPGAVPLFLGGEELFASPKVVLDSSAIKRAVSAYESPDSKKVVVVIELLADRQDYFYQFTKQHLGERLVLTLDGTPVCTATLKSPIPAGRFNLTGNLSPKQAAELASKLTPAAR
jgi:preprotein translocase subunit SecD